MGYFNTLFLWSPNIFLTIITGSRLFDEDHAWTWYKENIFFHPRYRPRPLRNQRMFLILYLYLPLNPS
jgi:hypothetical protein